MNYAAIVTGTTHTKAQRLLREQVAAVLRDFKLSPMDWSMLGVLAETRHGVLYATVAEELHVKAPLVTVMARGLIAKRLVRSVNSQFDARGKLLALTPEGKKQLKTIEAALNRRLKPLFADVSDRALSDYQAISEAIIAHET